VDHADVDALSGNDYRPAATDPALDPDTLPAPVVLPTATPRNRVD